MHRQFRFCQNRVLKYRRVVPLLQSDERDLLAFVLYAPKLALSVFFWLQEGVILTDLFLLKFILLTRCFLSQTVYFRRKLHLFRWLNSELELRIREAVEGRHHISP